GGPWSAQREQAVPGGYVSLDVRVLRRRVWVLGGCCLPEKCRRPRGATPAGHLGLAPLGARAHDRIASPRAASESGERRRRAGRGCWQIDAADRRTDRPSRTEATRPDRHSQAPDAGHASTAVTNVVRILFGGSLA